MVDKLECICDGSCPMTEDRHWINCPAHAHYAAYLAMVATPTEDARERVKVLEEALGKAREYVERKSWDAYDNREDQLLVVIDTALGNKETDRHG